MSTILKWIKRRFDQEGTLILIVIGCVIIWVVFFKNSNKQVNNADYKNASIGHITNNYGKGKRFTPFVEGFGGVSSDGDSRAEAGARVGVRIDF